MIVAIITIKGVVQEPVAEKSPDAHRSGGGNHIADGLDEVGKSRDGGGEGPATETEEYRPDPGAAGWID